MRARARWFVVFCLALVPFVYLGTQEPHIRRAHAQSDPGPYLLASGWAISQVATSTAVFSTNLVPHAAGSVIRIGVVLTTSSVLSIKETDGTNTFTSTLNGGTALTAGSMYTFVWECRCKTAIGGPSTGPTGINFVVGNATAIPILRVSECVGGID